MRVLRLGLGDGHSVDLHPAVSVVTALADHQRTALRRGFSAIGTGLAPADPGLLEAHGLLLDATQDDLDLLDVPATPAPTVATAAEMKGTLPEDEAERLRTAERDLLLLATDRWEAWLELTRAEPAAPRPVPIAGGQRAAELRSRIARHGARDAEAVRTALDELRDRQRAGASPSPEELAVALAGVGLDVADLGLPAGEVVRIAEDWLDERRREADWVVGATVELQGIEEALAADLHAPLDDRAGVAPADDLAALRRRAARATATHVDAVVRADELRTELLERHSARPGVDELESHLSARLGHHRPERLAGAVPLVIDGVLGHLDDSSVEHLLDRIAVLADTVQVVVIADHVAARAWAEASDIRQAALVSPAAEGAPA